MERLSLVRPSGAFPGRSRRAAAPLLLMFLAGMSAVPVSTAEAPAGEDMAEKVFKTPADQIIVKDPSKAAICPICGQPLWKHAEPGFVCRPKGKKIIELEYRRVQCPVCGFRFKAPKPGSGPQKGEMDTDFCRHPIGKDAFIGTVWMCPRCGFAAPAGTFEHPVSKETAEFVRKKLTPKTLSDIKTILRLPDTGVDDVSFLDQLDIPETVKYHNALALMERNGSLPPIERGKLYLEAVHAARRAVCAPIANPALTKGLLLVDKILAPEVPGLPVPPREKIRRLEEFLARGTLNGKPLPLDREFCIDVVLAGLYDRIGDREQAEACLNAAEALLEAVPETYGKRKEAFRREVTFRRRCLVEEAVTARAAVGCFLEALQSGAASDPGTFLAYGYLVGELQRRVGEFRKARAWFSVLEPLAAKMDPELRKWMLLGLSSERMRIPPDEVELAAVRELYSASKADSVVPLDGGTSATGGSAAERPGGTSSPAASPWPDKPASCKEFMERFYESVRAFRSKKGRWPSSVGEMVEEGVLPAYAADDFRCPETGVPYYYKPPKGGGKDFILYHKDPMNCKCRNILYSDGEIKTLPVSR